MQTPTPSPAPYIAACHAGAAARALEASYRAQVAETEQFGRDVLRHFMPSQLAAALYAAVFVEQLEGRLAGIDLDPIEDLKDLLLRLEHDDEQARAS